MEFEGSVGVVSTVVREDIQERPHKVEALPSHVGDQEDGAYPLANELCSGVNALLAIADKSWDLSGAWTLHDLGDLSNGFLENIGWADINLGHHYHDGDVES